jgi:hypothetical protein
MTDDERPTPGDHLSGAVFAMAVLSVIPAVAWAVTAGDLAPPLTLAGAVGTALATAAMLMVYGVTGALRLSGRPRLAAGGYVLAAVLVVAAAYAYVELPRTVLAHVPVPAVIAAALLVAWLST